MKKYKFFNFPKKYGIEDYKAAIQKIAKRYSKLDGLKAVYNWGGPSVPGISDIDLVMVFRRHAKSLPFLNRSFYFIGAKSRYLVRHPFMFIDEESFRQIRFVYPMANFVNVFGAKIKINKLSKIQDYFAKIALLNDIIIRHYPRDFLWQLVSREINVRDTLLRLNSLNYTIKILEDVANTKNSEWNRKMMLIKELRANWFKNNNFELLISLNEDAVGISLEIIEEFKEFLFKKRIIEILAKDEVQYNGIKNKSLFIKNWSKKEALNEMARSIKKQRFYSALPIEFATQLIEYSKYYGLISNYIRSNIKGDVNYRLKYDAVIGERIRILNSQAELASRLKHSDFAAFFDFGYRQKKGINNWLLNFVDKLRFSP